MTAFETGLQDLKRQHPEWEPWLAVVDEILRETATSNWDAAVPTRTDPQQSKIPLLAGAKLALGRNSVRALLERLIRIASQRGTPKMATLKSALRADVDAIAVFIAALSQDEDRIKELSAIAGVDGEAFHAVTALIPVPFLQACNRRWATSIAESWMEGYCPVCGAWPAFAEVRGIERSRYFRCGRCGGEWQAHCLFCPYCSITDHEQLVSLVPEKIGASRIIEACKRCLGYVKTFTTLQGTPPMKVMIEDLASVALDVAAVEHGYKRPQGAGYALAVMVTENGRRRSLFA
jgi:FdhE protein